jgi:hypothetical protein
VELFPLGSTGSSGLVNATLAGGYMTLGAAPALSGDIRLPYGNTIKSRLASNAGDMTIVRVDGSLGANTVTLGDALGSIALLAGVGSFVIVRNLPVFADNAAAAAGGVPVDGLYRTAAGAPLIRV